MDTSASDIDDLYCAEAAQADGEPLYGSAVEAEVWLLLEMNGSWRAKATSDNDLPGKVRQWMAEQTDADAGRRWQFIRQPGRQTSGGVSFVVAVVRERERVMYRFELDGYGELLNLDVDGIVRGEARYGSFKTEEPMFLVCTNGKRDRCCALFGRAFYQAMSKKVGNQVWQTTHLGGHRFAPTGLVLPDGVMVGYLGEADAARLAAAQASGEVLLERMRGRPCFDVVVQTAEYFLRRATGELGLDTFRLLGKRTVEGGWSIAFSDRQGVVHRIGVAADGAPVELMVSCGAARKERQLYRFEGHEILG